VLKHTANQIYIAIQKATEILLIPHQHPDGDTLGAVSSCLHFFSIIGKPAQAYCATTISPRLQYLPHVNSISNDPLIWNNEMIDLLMVFDSGDLRYAGVDHLLRRMKKRPTIVNIDHHVTNEYFGDYNLVIPNASSTTEIMHRFFMHNKITIDKTMATALLTGVLTDTDAFSNAATSSGALAIGSQLLSRGGNFTKILNAIWKEKTLSSLKIWGLTFSRLQKNKAHDIVHTFTTQEDLQRLIVPESELDGVANFLNFLNEGKATLILKELPDQTVKGSFRTTRNDVDVSVWAKALGGGGHKKAAGFAISPPLETAAERIFQTIEKLSTA